MIPNVTDKVARDEEPIKRKRGRPTKTTAPKVSAKKAQPLEISWSP